MPTILRLSAAAQCAAVLLVAGCASQPPILPPRAPAVELRQTPFFAQEKYQCGPAALAMVLDASGMQVTPDALVAKVYIPKRKGSLQAEMIAAVRSYGRIPYLIQPSLRALRDELRAGHAVLILENLGWSFYPDWHYAVVIGTLPADDAIVLRSGTTRRKQVDARRFLVAWDKSGKWGFVVLKPSQLPADDDATRYLQSVAAMESLGHYGVAAIAYLAATRRWPNQLTAWIGLGNTRYQLGDLGAAERAFRTALDEHPEAVIARNNLAQVLLDRGCIEQARRQIQRAAAIAPDSLQSAVDQTQQEIQRRSAKTGSASGGACGSRSTHGSASGKHSSR